MRAFRLNVFIIAAFLVAALVPVLVKSVGAHVEADAPTIGYAGCSVTEMSVLGCALDGGQSMWASNTQFDGGTPVVWARFPARYWGAFDSLDASRPADIAWYEVCTLATDDSQATLENARSVLAEIRARLPKARIYVAAYCARSAASAR